MDPSQFDRAQRRESIDSGADSLSDTTVIDFDYAHRVRRKGASAVTITVEDVKPAFYRIFDQIASWSNPVRDRVGLVLKSAKCDLFDHSGTRGDKLFRTAGFKVALDELKKETLSEPVWSDRERRALEEAFSQLERAVEGAQTLLTFDRLLAPNPRTPLSERLALVNDKIVEFRSDQYEEVIPDLYLLQKRYLEAGSAPGPRQIITSSEDLRAALKLNGAEVSDSDVFRRCNQIAATTESVELGRYCSQIIEEFSKQSEAALKEVLKIKDRELLSFGERLVSLAGGPVRFVRRLMGHQHV